MAGCLGDPGEDCFPSRWVFALMGFWSVAFAYILRVDINLALVGMVNHTALDAAARDNYERWLADHGGNESSDVDGGGSGPPTVATTTTTTSSSVVCPPFGDPSAPPLFSVLFADAPPPPSSPATSGSFSEGGNSTRVPAVDGGNGTEVSVSSARIDGPFVWEETTQTFIIAIFFGGHLWTQLFGGRIAEHLGGKGVIAFAMASAAVLHFLVPLAAANHFYLLAMQRFLTGLCLGFTVPTLNVMISKWCPPEERSRMNAAVHSGQLYGTVMALPLTGAILGTFGWQAVFYITGFLAVIQAAAWIFIVHESPGSHPSINRAELTNIEHAIGKQRGKARLPVPWKDLLSSGPFWAIVIGVIGNSCGYSIMLALLPTYLSEMLHLSVEENGVVSAIPFLAQALTSLPASILIDCLRRRRLASITFLRKMSHSIGQIGAGSMIILLPYFGCDRRAAMYVLAVMGAVQGFNLSAFSANMLDIAPNFSGTITGIAHIGYNVVSIVAPLTAGAALSGMQTFRQWSLIFYACAAFYWTGAMAFILLASGEEQPWNQPPPPSSPKARSWRRVWPPGWGSGADGCEGEGDELAADDDAAHYGTRSDSQVYKHSSSSSPNDSSAAGGGLRPKSRRHQQQGRRPRLVRSSSMDSVVSVYDTYGSMADLMN